jgi:hypothetical protein
MKGPYIVAMKGPYTVAMKGPYTVAMKGSSNLLRARDINYQLARSYELHPFRQRPQRSASIIQCTSPSTSLR